MWLAAKWAALVSSPASTSVALVVYIVSYYLVSGFCLGAAKWKKAHPDKTLPRWHALWDRNSVLDVVTTVLWVLAAIIGIWSLIELSITQTLSLPYLVAYYILFIFLFGFLYALVEWHLPGQLKDCSSGTPSGADTSSWASEFEYILLSLRLQAGVDAGSFRLSGQLMKLVGALQSLLGLFFVVVFIAQAVSALS